MRPNRIFVLAGIFAAILYFAPTKDPASAPKDAQPTTKAAGSTCLTNETFETGAVKLGATRPSEWTTTETLE